MRRVISRIALVMFAVVLVSCPVRAYVDVFHQAFAPDSNVASVSVNPMDGSCWLVDAEGGRIAKVDANGNWLAGDWPDSAPGPFAKPTSGRG